MNWKWENLAAVWLAIAIAAPAQQDVATDSSADIVPSLVRYTGALPGHAGERVSLQLSIYATADSGSALWSERQAIEVGADGSYTLLLGAGSSIALPTNVFAAGQARWLGVRMGDGEELPRVLLTSVPYAMKAADAETVGGFPARSFVTQQQLASMARTIAAQVAPAVLPDVTPSGSGDTNYLARWINSSTLGDSGIYQSSENIGIGTSTPSSALHVYSGDLTIGGFALKFPTTPLGTASINQLSSVSLLRQTLGDGSGRFNMYWNAYNDTQNNKYYVSGEPATKWNIGGVNGGGGTGVYVAPSGTANGPVKWNTVFSSDTLGNTSLANQAMYLHEGGNVGIGTTTPAAKLEVNGTAKFDGLATFASGQTFPGTAQLGVAETFTQPVTLSDGATASQSGGGLLSALSGFGTNGSVGVYGSSDTGNAAVFTNDSLPNATVVVTNNSPTYSGQHFPAALSATAGGEGGIGVAGSAMGSYGIAVEGNAASGYGGYFSNSSTYDAALFAENMATSFPNDNSATGVVGTAPYPYGTGVSGQVDGNNGWGVYGWVLGDGGIGVWGEADGTVDTGGSGRNAIGVKGVGTGADGYGVVGDETANGGYGVYGYVSGEPDSFHGTPVGTYGLADHGIGVLGVLSGNSGTYLKYIGNGLVAGIWGDTSIADKTGVNGTADNAAAANFINNSNSYSTVYLINNGTGGTGAAVLTAVTPKGSCDIADGDFACTGQMKSLVNVDGGARTVETYAMRSPENWSEDFGTGALVHGIAVVKLEAGFAETIASNANYHVFLTPRGDSNGLYVTNVTPTSFEVHESHGGTSSLAFDYRIVAKQRGYETVRLADVTERVRSQRQAMLQHLPTGNAPALPIAHEQSMEGRQRALALGARNRLAQLHRNLGPGGLAQGIRSPAAPMPKTPITKPLSNPVLPK